MSICTRWGILAAALLAQTTAAVATQGIGVLSSFMSLEFGLSNAQVGLLAGVLNSAPILGLIVAGRWLDKSGERLVVGSGALLMGVGMLLASYVETLPTLFICLFLVGVGYSSVQPGGTKAVFVWFPANERGTAMGLRQAGLPLGGVLAAALFPPIASEYGWQMAFVAGAAIIVSGAAVFCLVYRPPDENLILPKSRAVSDESAFCKSIAALPWAQPMFRLALVLGVIMVSLQTITITFLLLYLQAEYAMTIKVGALYLLVMQLSGAAGRVLLSIGSDHLRGGRRFVLAITALGAGFGLLALGMISSTWHSEWLLVIAAWIGFFAFGWYGPWVTWIAELAPLSRVGTTLGVAMAINQLAIVMSPIVFGSVADAFGYTLAGALLAFVLSTYLLFEGWTWLRERRE